MTRETWMAALLLLTAFLLAYLPDIGHGFVSDDFTWLVAARGFLESPSLSSLFTTTNFLRPVVTLSFAGNLSIAGGNAVVYGLTNLLLVVLCAGVIYRVGRTLALAPSAALVGAATWAFNFHGINMSMLWISGRTSLLLTLFSLLAAVFLLSGRRWVAACFCAAALFSKEEAVALPLILLIWSGIRLTWPLLLPLAAYFIVRLQTSAFWPQQAPDYYRFTTDLLAVATNAAHYVDRSATVFAFVAILLLLGSRSLPRFSADHRANLVRGLAWLAGGFALTVWVPVRSSLYAVFPSVGTALLLATMADALSSQAPARRLRRTVVALLTLPFLLWPVYRARNVRWVELADLTSAVVPQMAPHVTAMRDGALVWIDDDDSTRANIRNAFGGQMDSAMQFEYGVRPSVLVDTDVRDPPPGALALQFRGGQLQDRQRIDIH